MKWLKSEMFKSSKFVQWIISAALIVVVFLVMFIPLMWKFVSLLFSEGLDGALDTINVLFEQIKSTIIVTVGSLLSGSGLYGTLNQIQKRAPTEIIKAESKYSEPQQDKWVPEIPPMFTGIVLKRVYHKQSTISDLHVMVNGDVLFECKALELPWKNNERRKSCVPPGRYPLVKEESPKFGLVPELKNVPDRSEIKIHVANFAHQLEGCIAPGMEATDIDKDGIIDVASSRIALENIMGFLPDLSEIIIIGNVPQNA